MLAATDISLPEGQPDDASGIGYEQFHSPPCFRPYYSYIPRGCRVAVNITSLSSSQKPELLFSANRSPGRVQKRPASEIFLFLRIACCMSYRRKPGTSICTLQDAQANPGYKVDADRLPYNRKLKAQ